MIGEMFFEDFDELTNPVVGKVLYIIYIMFMSITILNLVIAILSDAYAIYTSRHQSLFLREVIQLRSRFGNSKTDCWRVSAFVPFNLVTLSFGFVLSKTCLKDRVKLNDFMMKIAYAPLSL